MSCTQEVRAQLEDNLQQRSPERLRFVADVADYLADAESEAATQELLAISGLLERVKHSEVIPNKDCKNWRELRSDDSLLRSLKWVSGDRVYTCIFN
jgi:hypothetical protein